MTQLGLKSIYNTTLQEEWASGIDTYLGATVRGYPNMFHIYGPHAPTLFSNGPAAIEVQGRFVGDMIGKLERQGVKYFNPTAEASQEWKKLVSHLSDITLFPHTRSTYMGGAVPGKKVEAMCFTGGLPLYRTHIRAAYDSLDGFELVKA
ncbi:hypothetical protein AAL_00270 [Moelleriella libera RCEF 2490]|uniref:Uncharacterized protein n=1 Tax=Moelleriella libera RCEF 2490 TaxID=1081109 RepID=A0A166RMV8_9HYPO|nr:hypothetical protein AAL_00270 [Moelleriella libera RCEF 2490]